MKVTANAMVVIISHINIYISLTDIYISNEALKNILSSIIFPSYFKIITDVFTPIDTRLGQERGCFPSKYPQDPKIPVPLSMSQGQISALLHSKHLSLPSSSHHSHGQQ